DKATRIAGQEHSTPPRSREWAANRNEEGCEIAPYRLADDDSARAHIGNESALQLVRRAQDGIAVVGHDIANTNVHVIAFRKYVRVAFRRVSPSPSRFGPVPARPSSVVSARGESIGARLVPISDPERR